MTNLNTAFDVAEKYLDIPKMLDAEGELMRRESVAFLPVLICQKFILEQNSREAEDSPAA